MQYQCGNQMTGIDGVKISVKKLMTAVQSVVLSGRCAISDPIG